MKSKVGQIFNLSSEKIECVYNRSVSKRQIKNLSYKRGFTLLEVMLALAILAGAIVVLGEFGRMGLRSAKTSRDLSRAEMLCESIMNQITAGILLPDPVQGEPIVDPVSGTTLTSEQTDDVAPWIYSIESETIDEDGLMSVRVIVQQDMPKEQHPVSFTLVRWIPDPLLDLLSESTETDSSGTEDTGTGTSTGSGTGTGTGTGTSTK